MSAPKKVLLWNEVKHRLDRERKLNTGRLRPEVQSLAFYIPFIQKRYQQQSLLYSYLPQKKLQNRKKLRVRIEY